MALPSDLAKLRCHGGCAMLVGSGVGGGTKEGPLESYRKGWKSDANDGLEPKSVQQCAGGL